MVSVLQPVHHELKCLLLSYCNDTDFLFEGFVGPLKLGFQALTWTVNAPIPLYRWLPGFLHVLHIISPEERDELDLAIDIYER